MNVQTRTCDAIVCQHQEMAIVLMWAFEHLSFVTTWLCRTPAQPCGIKYKYKVRMPDTGNCQNQMSSTDAGHRHIPNKWFSNSKNNRIIVLGSTLHETHNSTVSFFGTAQPVLVLVIELCGAGADFCNRQCRMPATSNAGCRQRVWTNQYTSMTRQVA